MKSRALFAMLALAPALLQAAATIVIINADGAGIGFNDPTPVAPVGGNTGTTLGQQRLNVFQSAADIWGAALTSAVTIQVQASWPASACNANSAVLAAPVLQHCMQISPARRSQAPGTFKRWRTSCEAWICQSTRIS